MSTEARVWSTCPACDYSIRPGDLIIPVEYDGAGWVHETCPPERAVAEVCAFCFMQKAINGTCGCDS